MDLRLAEARVEAEVWVGRRSIAALSRLASEQRLKAVAFVGMDEETGGDGLRERLTRQGEDALGRLAQDLLENPLVNGAIARAFEAREKAFAAQEVAFGALNIPSAADIERLTRRVRSVSQRLEGIEDGVDRLDERLAALQLSLDAITKELVELRTSAPRQTPPKPAAANRTPLARRGRRAPARSPPARRARGARRRRRARPPP